MKSVFKLSLPFFFSCAVLTSCSKSADTPTATESSTGSTTAQIISGNWVITSHVQRTENKTSQFSGFAFTFSDGGKLTATQNGSVTSGIWSYSPSSIGYYGGTPTKASLTLNLGTTKPVKNLTRTWNVVSNDSTILSLINPEPADDEHLVFTRK